MLIKKKYLLIFSIFLISFQIHPLLADTKVIRIPASSVKVTTSGTSRSGHAGPDFIYRYDSDYLAGKKNIPFLSADYPVQSISVQFGESQLSDANQSGKFSGSNASGNVNYSNGLYYLTFTQVPTTIPDIVMTLTYLTPGSTTTPSTPTTPTIPSTPSTPSTPITPSAPSTPTTPTTTPIIPTTPITPTTPTTTPTTPSTPVTPKTPAVPSTPTAPTNTPIIPTTPITPTTPTTTPTSPSTPVTPTTPSAPSTPTIPTIPADDLSDILNTIVLKYQLPGMAAVVIHGNRIASQGVSGLREKGRPEKLTLNDLYHIGSNTKSMTATLLEYVVQNTDLEWTTKIVDVFPELKGGINAGYANLTVAQLLQNRGGIPASADFWGIQAAAGNDLYNARQNLMMQVLQQAPAVTPGTFLYSNVSFIIAGHIAEKKMQGKTWEELTRSYLFEPLKMTSGGFGAPGTLGVYDQPRGHTSNDVPIEPGPSADNAAMLGPAGTVRLTLADWMTYVNTHLQAARGASQFETWLSSLGIPSYYKYADFSPMHVAVTEGGVAYAMGWSIGLMDGKNVILYHQGSNTLWYSVVSIDIPNDIAVLVVTNQGGDDAATAANEAVKQLLARPLK